MAYREVMAMPMKVFWRMQGNIGRIEADEQKQQLMLMLSAQSPEGGVELHEALSKRSPDPVRVTAEAIIASTSVRDEAGFEDLRRMASA
jgi:hypothetical protein